MAKIDEFLEKIKKAVYGEEVRSSIVGAIEQCYSDVKTNVEEVLEEHPEYTSTVLPGTIDENKLTTSLAGRINNLETDKVNKIDIANNLTTEGSGKVLDARQGKILNENIQVAANNIQVGARNLVPNSDAGLTGARVWDSNMSLKTHTFYKNNKRNMFCIANGTKYNSSSPSIAEKVTCSKYFDMEAGQTYTLSFVGFAGGNVANMDVYIIGRKKGSTTTVAQKIVSDRRLSTSKLEKVTVTFTAKDGIEEAYLRFDNNGTTDSNSAYLYFNEVKLEKGNKATDYTVATETNVQKRNRELLWSGSLGRSGTATLSSDSYRDYVLFMAQTSDGITNMLGFASDEGDKAVIRFIAGYDDGSSSAVLKANTEITYSNNQLKVISVSKHTLSSTGCAGTGLNLTKLWGIM